MRQSTFTTTPNTVLSQALASPPTSSYDRITTLGKLLLFDRNFSVNRDIACTSCHAPKAGFTGGIEVINRTIVAYPGSSADLVSVRKPQSYSYAPFAPVLHYNAEQKDLVGGNFWDMRATGIQLDNPAAEQAKGPPTNPLEMALPDQACAVYRISRRANDPGEKVDCWPAPEVQVNVDSTVGNLGLSDREEKQLVTFLRTLTDRRFGEVRVR